MTQTSRILEQFDTVSGNTVTLMQVTFDSGGVQYYAKVERNNKHGYELLWADWFFTHERARARIDQLEA